MIGCESQNLGRTDQSRKAATGSQVEPGLPSVAGSLIVSRV